MEQVMDWIDGDPKTREFYSELHIVFMDAIAKEFAPHALTFALAITQLENAYPEIAELAEDDGSEEE